MLVNGHRQRERLETKFPFKTAHGKVHSVAVGRKCNLSIRSKLTHTQRKLFQSENYPLNFIFSPCYSNEIWKIISSTSGTIFLPSLKASESRNSMWEGGGRGKIPKIGLAKQHGTIRLETDKRNLSICRQNWSIELTQKETNASGKGPRWLKRC